MFSLHDIYTASDIIIQRKRDNISQNVHHIFRINDEIHTICLHPKAQCAVESYTRFGINDCDCTQQQRAHVRLHTCTYYRANVVYLQTSDTLYGCACDQDKFIILNEMLKNFDHFKNTL